MAKGSWSTYHRDTYHSDTYFFAGPLGHKPKITSVMSISFVLPRLSINVKPMADALEGGLETYEAAIMDVICDRVGPSARMPITLPGSDAAIAVVVAATREPANKGFCGLP
jgi:hypothetical protein